MVLQPNSSKRADNENVVPHKNEGVTPRNFRTSFHAAASRRRARANGSKPSKYMAEQAKRRSIIKSPTNIMHMTIPKPTTSARTPPPIADVEMKDASPPRQPSTISMPLPLYLSRPDFMEVPTASIEAIDPEVAEINVTYIRDILRASTMGPSMYQSLRKYTAKDKDLLSRGVLPTEVIITVEDMAAILPTHMMAIYGPPPKNATNTRTKLVLFPVHSLILAANCAKLPPFPSGASSTTSRDVTLPICPLYLHSPKTFPILLQYLYFKRADILLSTLLASPLAMKPIDQVDQLEEFAKTLGTRFSPSGLIQQITVVHGIWQNACALGVFDDELWNTIDFAWKTLIMALAVATGNTEAVQLIKATAMALNDEQDVESDGQESVAGTGSDVSA